MIQRALILAFSLVSLTSLAKEDEKPPRHITAAYPMFGTIDNYAEVHPERLKPADLRSYPATDSSEFYPVAFKQSEIHKLPKKNIDFIFYDKTKDQIVASGSPKLHHWLNFALEADYRLSGLRMDCALYLVPTHEAQRICNTQYISKTKLPAPFLELNGIKSSSEPIINRANAGTIKATIEWDAYWSPHYLYTNGYFTLTVERFNKIYELKTRINLEPTVPCLFALGTDSAELDKTIVAMITFAPVSPQGGIMINGRICTSMEDHLTLEFYSGDRLTATNPGDPIPIHRYQVPPDFIPQDKDYPHVFLEPKDTPGLDHGGKEWIDASPYLKSRGIPMTDQDWAAFRPEMSRIYTRIKDTTANEHVQFLTGYYRSRLDSSQPALTRFDVSAQSRSIQSRNPLKATLGYYSITTLPGSPARLTILERQTGEEYNELTKIEIDPTVGYNSQILDLSHELKLPLDIGETSFFNLDADTSMQSGKPLRINTGLDDSEQSSLWIELEATLFHALLPTPK